MGIVAWLVVGAVAGYLTAYVVRGEERPDLDYPRTFVWPVVLGVIGAAIGGVIAGIITGIDFVTGFDVVTIVVAALGAIAAVYLWSAMASGRWTGGPVA